MDTIVEITAYGPNSKRAVNEALRVYERIDGLTNRYNAISQISLINNNAGIRAVQVDQELFELLKIGIILSEQSAGAFDITIGALTDLWGIGKKEAAIPSDADIERALSVVSYKYLKLDEDSKTAYLTKKGASIDVGAIAKGYATDKAIEILKSYKIKSAIINAGGSISVIGNNPKGQAWRIGIQHPREKDKILAQISMAGYNSLQTSGDYQRFNIINDKKYSHILDPRTGKQPEKLASVTIVNNNSTVGDFLSTAVFVLGKEEGLKLLRNYYDTQAIIYTLEGDFFYTSKLESILTEMR